MLDKGKVANAAAWCLSAILLVVIIWRVEAVGERVRQPRHQGSGQIHEGPWGSTERWIVNGELEPMAEWTTRILEAKLEFEQEKYQ